MKAIFTMLTTLLLGLLISFSASANDFAAAIGFRSNSADLVSTTGVTASVDSKTGFGAGVIGFFDMGADFQIRSGFLYNQRSYKVSYTSPIAAEAELNLAYIDIPVTAMYKFADYAGAFAGPVVGLLASKECKLAGGTCAITKDPESLIVGLQFGASFKFAPQLGAELYYETIPSEFWKDGLKNARTVGVNLLFTFE
jgi:hypothetical protein